MNAAKVNEDKIIKMQANIRGFLSRKGKDSSDMQPVRFKKNPVGASKNRPAGVKKGEAYAIQISDMPDHRNENIKAIEIKLGAFVYDEADESEEEQKQLISRKPYEMDNGVTYLG